jgi:predicted nuclease with TOPRIM domain
MGLCQVADFVDHVVSGALTADVAAEVESLWAQHADAVREKSAAERKSHRLSEKVAAMEAEKTDLRRQLAEERREANKAIADVQAAQAEAKVARAEGSLARQRAEELEARFNTLRSHVDKAEASTHAQFVDAYRELGARTADFEVPGQEAGLRFLEWLQEELLVLPTIVTGFMSFASLVTCEGAVTALSREGCRHYDVFDQADENFECEIFKVEGPVLKQSAGALFDRMWGPHGREAVRERSDQVIEQVKVVFCVVICAGMCGFAE